MRTFLRNAVVTLGLLAAWLLLDLIDVKVYRLPTVPFTAQGALALVFALYLLANRQAFAGRGRLSRAVLIALGAAMLTTAWVIVSTPIVLAFHLAIGGHL